MPTADDINRLSSAVNEQCNGQSLSSASETVRALGGTAVCGPYEDGWRVFVSVPKKRWTMESRD